MPCATHMFKCGSALTQVLDEEKRMNESLESPTRRLLMKGMAGLGATLVSSSLSEAIAAQTHQPGAPGNQVPPDQVGWGPFTPSSGEGLYLQVVYPSSTTKRELQIRFIYSL